MKLIKDKKGFFVIETIVVVAIVAIVITYIFTHFSNTYNRFVLSESYNSLTVTNAVLNVKTYIEDIKIDYLTTLEGRSFIEISEIFRVNTEYYKKLRDHLKIKRVYLINTDTFYVDSNNLNTFDVKMKRYLDTLSKVKSKFILVAELEDFSYGYMSIYNYNLELVGNPDKEYVTYVKVGTPYQEPGYAAEDKNGNKLDVLITGVIDTSIPATYYLTYSLHDIALKRKVVVYDEVINFGYTGNYQVFTAPIGGTYRIELWGAQGGRTSTTTSASKGGYSKGEIYLNEGDTFYIFVGEEGKLGTYGIAATSTVGQGAPATFNGGGGGGNAGGGAYPYQNYTGGPSGGGATDIRTVSGVWNNLNSLRSRIMISGAGGGSGGDAGYDITKGNSGGLSGEKGAVAAYLVGTYEHHVSQRGVGGTQTTGHGFGIAGNGDNTGAPTYCSGHAGGGGGYYGGTGGLQTGGSCHIMGGGGGSSFISGFTGVNAINADGTASGQPNHFSGYKFKNMDMKAGNQLFPSPSGGTETGHTGNGYAKITLINPNPENTLSKVRYVYNEVNGSTANYSGHWVEMQVYDINGNNISQGLTSITSSTATNLNMLTDGNIASASYIEGGQGITYVMIDLGQEYDLSSIRLWHYYADGRTYYGNKVKVASADQQLRTIMDEQYKETSYGKIIRPESLN